jgi:hypothetical protein
MTSGPAIPTLRGSATVAMPRREGIRFLHRVVRQVVARRLPQRPGRHGRRNTGAAQRRTVTNALTTNVDGVRV